MKKTNTVGGKSSIFKSKPIKKSSPVKGKSSVPIPTIKYKGKKYQQM